MADRVAEPGLIEQATVLLGAARNVTGPLRPFYTAQARLAFDRAAEELRALGVSLQSVESDLEREAQSNG